MVPVPVPVPVVLVVLVVPVQLVVLVVPAPVLRTTLLGRPVLWPVALSSRAHGTP
jgi:hypothetical protein